MSDHYVDREDEAGCWLGIAMIILSICSCANTSRNVNQGKKPEKVPAKIEHRQNVATNQFYKAKQAYLIHTR